MKFLLLATFAYYVCANNVSAMQRFFVIVFENTDFNVTFADPYFKQLAEQGQLFTNYHGVIHPSQPNYIAMIAGDTFNKTTDNDVDISGKETVVDLLERANRTWVAYQQDYPKDQGCFTNTSFGGESAYVRKHNPFISFAEIRNSPERCSRIFNADQLLVDIEHRNVSDYVFYTPNLQNDAHDTNITFASMWLKSFLEPILVNQYFINTTFLITFDENYVFWLDDDNYIETKNNTIYSVLLGAGVRKGIVDDLYYNHYSQLAFIEHEWGLGSLGRNDSNANFFRLETSMSSETRMNVFLMLLTILY